MIGGDERKRKITVTSLKPGENMSKEGDAQSSYSVIFKHRMSSGQAVKISVGNFSNNGNVNASVTPKYNLALAIIPSCARCTIWCEQFKSKGRQ